MGVRLRPMRKGDARDLVQVYTDAFGPTTARQAREYHGGDCPFETLVAEVDGVVASVVTTEYRTLLVDGVPIRTGAIAGVATRWEYRGRGLATRLMKMARRRLAAKGISNATLFTGLNLPAIRIYRRLGYTEEQEWNLGYRFGKDPVPWIEARFSYRNSWLPKTPYGREALRHWRERVLFEGPGWAATVTWDGKKFKVLRGRRGRPTLTMQGPAAAIVLSFGNVLAYDQFVGSGRVKITGDKGARAVWRRIISREWAE